MKKSIFLVLAVLFCATFLCGATECYAAEPLYGMWTSTNASYYYEDAFEYISAPSADYSLSLYEDGCFPEAFEGTWIYEGANGRGTPQFCLNTKDGFSSFHHVHEGELVSYYTDGGKSIGVYMEKVK